MRVWCGSSTIVGLSLCVCWAPSPCALRKSVYLLRILTRQARMLSTNILILAPSVSSFHHGNKNLTNYQKSSQLQPLVNWIVHPLHHLSSNRSIIHKGEKLPLPIWVLSISTLKRSKAWKAEKIQRAKARNVQQRKRFESFSVLQLPAQATRLYLIHTIPNLASYTLLK